MHSPARFEHSDILLRIAQLLSTFAQVHGSGRVLTEKALVGLTRNDYAPDICFWRTEKSATFQPKQMVFPAPDLIVEVLSLSTEERDRGVKFDDYAAHGIGEFWIIDPETKTVEQYILEGSNYQRIAAGAATIKSVAMEGFEAPIAAFFDDAANLAGMRKILSA